MKDGSHNANLGCLISTLISSHSRTSLVTWWTATPSLGPVEAFLCACWTSPPWWCAAFSVWLQCSEHLQLNWVIRTRLSSVTWIVNYAEHNRIILSRERMRVREWVMWLVLLASAMCQQSNWTFNISNINSETFLTTKYWIDKIIDNFFRRKF